MAQMPVPNAPRPQFATPAAKVVRGMAPGSPHQVAQRLPLQNVMTRPVCNNTIQRPGLQNNFVQPPSPFSPQAPQSPHDFPQSPAPTQQTDNFQRFENAEGFNQSPQVSRSNQMPGSTPTYSTSPRNDIYAQPPGTPRPQTMFNAPAPRTTQHVYAPSRAADPYATQPGTPSPVQNYMSPRPEELRTENQGNEVFNQQPEVNRQLRDLLQRQQFVKQDQVKPAGQIWNHGTSIFQSNYEFFSMFFWSCISVLRFFEIIILIC